MANMMGKYTYRTASAYACFTTLSSNEWKVIIHNLPPFFKQSIESFTVLYKGLNSSLTSILIAWKVRFAGCPSFCLDLGIEFSIIFTNSFVVSISFSILYKQIFLYIFLSNLYSPYSEIISNNFSSEYVLTIIFAVNSWDLSILISNSLLPI